MLLGGMTGGGTGDRRRALTHDSDRLSWLEYYMGLSLSFPAVKFAIVAVLCNPAATEAPGSYGMEFYP